MTSTVCPICGSTTLSINQFNCHKSSCQTTSNQATQAKVNASHGLFNGTLTQLIKQSDDTCVFFPSQIVNEAKRMTK
ncbi:MAG: hypothetical protein ACRCXZ_00430 [Patescibacteria group bacterium]